jgi:hypothetical protein
MHGAAAAAAHRHIKSSGKNHSKTTADNTIEAGDQDLIASEPCGNESGDGKNVDPEYNEEQDHLYLFPPPRFQKGDISLGVLMSG